MIQGFMDGAVFRTDLSWPAIVAFEMGLRPDQFRYPIYEWPHGPGGVPVDLQRLMKAFEQYFGGRSSATLTAMSGPRRVFLSHTSEFDEWRPEGRSCVDLAKDACSRQGFQFGDMSLWSARPHEPAEECRTRVKACDIYVGIIGSRYGSVVRDEEHHSYTELEYETAKARGIPRLVFLLSDEASMPVRFAKDPEYGARQEAFRAQLGEDGITLARFKTPDELAHLIDIGLGSIAAAGAGRSTGLPQIDLRDIATAGLWVRSYVDRIEDYYERGPGSRTPPSGDPFHNMGVYHWDVLDAALSTATLVEQRIHTPPRDDWTTVVANSADRVAWGVLARARKGRRAGTVCDAVARLARDGGVETLLVSLGLNNALGAMTSLAPAWTPSGYPGMSPNERLAAKSSSNVWRPSAFAADWSILEAELRKSPAQRIVIATIPSVTIAPIARGFGAKVRPESRYFPYYTWPWISDDFFDPSRDAHVTEDEARAIDSAVDAYNETIIDSVARARADGLDWQVLELGGLVERLAFRRYVESPWARPGWWEPFEMPTELAAAHPVPNTRFFRAGPEGRIDGGLYSLDGAHPTTTGYALIADECMRLLQQAGVEFRSRNGQVRPAPASVDFARILASDTLNSDPPIVPTIGFLGWIEPLVNWVERNRLWSGFKRG